MFSRYVVMRVFCSFGICSESECKLNFQRKRFQRNYYQRLNNSTISYYIKHDEVKFIYFHLKCDRLLDSIVFPYLRYHKCLFLTEKLT